MASNKAIDPMEDKVHKSRYDCLVQALSEEITLCYQFGNKRNIEQLYDSASQEFFTLDEKDQIFKDAIKRFETENNVKVINEGILQFVS